MNSEKIYHLPFTTQPEQALWLNDFTFPWLDRQPPETRFRAWHDGNLFHFEFLVVDHDIVLNPTGSNDEKVLGSDRVEIFISPTNDLSKPYYGFEMDPRGLIYDYRGVFHRQFDPTWTSGQIKTSTKITPTGYHLEGSIPLNHLRELGCLSQNRMITGVYRGEFSHRADGSIQQDWISWVNPGTQTPDFHIPETFGLFEFENLPEKG
jgi:Carbohydrate family 9 binding domain-like